MLTIDAATEGMPQKLAFDKYRNQGYFSLILQANGLVHPSEMVAGLRIRIPIKTMQPKNKVRKTRTL